MFRISKTTLRVNTDKSACYFIGFGLASHLGVLTGIPTIGVGKNMYFIDGMTKDDNFKHKVSTQFLTIDIYNQPII